MPGSTTTDVRSHRRSRAHRRANLLAIAATGALITGAAAQGGPEMNVFQAGTPIRAAEVNENFQAVVDYVAAALHGLNVDAVAELAALVDDLKAALESGEVLPRGLEFVWDGARLGVRPAGEGEYAFVDLTGPQGPQGPQGEPGLSLLHGEGAPTGDVGRDGEFYVDTTTWTLYGPKTNGAWSPSVSMVGPQGPQGPAGPQGPVGPQGPAGPEGPRGPAGAGGLPVLHIITELVQVPYVTQRVKPISCEPGQVNLRVTYDELFSAWIERLEWVDTTTWNITYIEAWEKWPSFAVTKHCLAFE